MQVWLIDAGAPGHTVQVAGVGAQLEALAGARCEWVRCHSRVRGAARGAARWLTGRAGPRSAPRLMRALHRGLALPASHPDVVVASCGDSAYLTRLLGRATGAVTVFIGEVAPFPAGWFDVVVVPAATGLPGGLTAPLMETGQTREKAAAAAARYWPGGAPAGCWTMLIGGASRSHRFGAGDWRALAGEMNRLAGEQGIRWLVTTSRRTGAAAEAVLTDALAPGAVAEAVWWGREPKKSVAAFLHAGRRVFVTRDSLTMISEAVAVKEQAEAVHPAECRIAPGSIMAGYLAQLEQAGRIRVQPVGRLEAGPPPPVGRPIGEAQEAFARRLVGRIRGLLEERGRGRPQAAGGSRAGDAG